MYSSQQIQKGIGFVNVLVDDQDRHLVEGKDLRVWRTGHVYLNGRGAPSLAEAIIGPPPPGMVIDHEDRNPLNNQRYNLRHVPEFINARNRSLASNNTTGFKGVCQQHGKFYASLQLETGTHRSRGYTTAQQAALAYDQLVAAHAPSATTNASLGLLCLPSHRT